MACSGSLIFLALRILFLALIMESHRQGIEEAHEVDPNDVVIRTNMPPGQIHPKLWVGNWSCTIFNIRDDVQWMILVASQLLEFAEAQIPAEHRDALALRFLILFNQHMPDDLWIGNVNTSIHSIRTDVTWMLQVAAQLLEFQEANIPEEQRDALAARFLALFVQHMPNGNVGIQYAQRRATRVKNKASAAINNIYNEAKASEAAGQLTPQQRTQLDDAKSSLCRSIQQTHPAVGLLAAKDLKGERVTMVEINLHFKRVQNELSATNGDLSHGRTEKEREHSYKKERLSSLAMLEATGRNKWWLV
ncbi:hypothetical protein MTO96_027148 [Rhipicephalus appendiculatus]